MHEVIAPAKITKEQVAGKAKAWLAQGPFGYTDPDSVQIEVVTAYFVPFVSVTCQWTAGWWGRVGYVDRGALGNARNTYGMAKSLYERVPDNERYRHQRPKEPIEDDFVLWESGSGTVNGQCDFNRAFAANVDGRNVPDGFRAWSTKICEKLVLSDSDIVRKDDPCLYASLDYHSLQVLPVFSLEDICGSLAPTVNKQIGKTVNRALPKYNSGINYDGVSFNNPNAAWQVTEALTLPIYLIQYRVPKGAYSFLMDGITGTVFAGDRAKDYGGFFARLRAPFIKMFGAKKATSSLSVEPLLSKATSRQFGVGGKPAASFALIAAACVLIGLISVSTTTTPRVDNSHQATAQGNLSFTAGSSVSPLADPPLAVTAQSSTGSTVQPSSHTQPLPTNLPITAISASLVPAQPSTVKQMGNSRMAAIEREQIDIGGRAGDSASVIRKDGIGTTRASVQIRMDLDRELKACSDQYLTYRGNDPDQAGYSSCVAYARENLKGPTTPTAYANCRTGELIGFFNSMPRMYAGQILHPLDDTQNTSVARNFYVEHVLHFQGFRVDSSEASGTAVDGAIFRKLCPSSFMAAPTTELPVITYKQNCLDNLVEAKRVANAGFSASPARPSITRAWNVKNEGTDWAAARCSADIILSNKQQLRLDFSQTPRNGRYLVEAKVSPATPEVP